MTDQPKVIITLSTVPERLEFEDIKGVPSVIHALCEQEYDNYEIHFNVPFIHKVKNKEYVIPVWLENLQKKFKHLYVYRTEDYGPPTKIIPTLHRIEDPDAIIIVLDDDFVYNKQTVKEHVKFQKEFLRAAIGYDGLDAVIPKFGDGRDRFVCLVDSPTEAGILQHYRTVSYKRSYFEQDFFDLFVGKTLSDDVLVSLYMRYKDVSLLVVPIPDHKPIATVEEYNETISKLQFPLVNRGAAPSDSGACDPEILKLQPRFFMPVELENLVKQKKPRTCNMNENILYDLGIKHETDKSRPHFYTPYYDNFFHLEKHNIQNVLEIGIYNGGSIRMWRDYFVNATIYGIDLAPSPFNKTEQRIITGTIDQSSREELRVFIDVNGIENFDVIIDDGSHTMKDQQISLAFLFKQLKHGGTYVLEDLHTSVDVHGDRYGVKTSLITTYEMLTKFIETNHIESEWMTEEEKNYLRDNIDYVKIIIPEGRTIHDSCTSLIIKK